jgi:hypothetical protein
VTKAILEILENKVSKAIKEILEILVLLDLKESLEHLVHVALMARPVLRERLAHEGKTVY